jgi:hypothetical protein
VSMIGVITLAATLASSAGSGVDARHSPHLAAAHRADTLRIAIVVDDSAAHRSLIRGATLGAEEAAHTGVLFGQPVTMIVLGRAAIDPAARGALRAGLGPAASIYIVAGDSTFCSQFMQQSARPRAPVLDAGCPQATPIEPTVYAIDSRPASSAAADGAHLELWHSSLERFGAEQLNQRFRRRFNEAMDSDAWAGWFATKIALDLALHAQAVSHAALLAQLADPKSSFDGQKGRPLRFAPPTHRLVQPLYRVVGVGDSSHVVAEVAP